ncbi:patatin-like phospholipase family protein [Nannocystaceae bacterium ST9]
MLVSLSIASLLALSPEALSPARIDICLTRAATETNPIPCVVEIAEQLRRTPISALFGADITATRAALKAVIGGPKAVELEGDEYCGAAPCSHPLGGDEEETSAMQRWRQAVMARDNLVRTLEDMNRHSQNGEFEIVQDRAVEIREVVLPQLQRELRSLNAMISGNYGMVVRGGVSMGIYQAGFLYYLTAYLREYRAQLGQESKPFQIVAGTSAGGMNALAVTLESCRQATSSPTESLFYTMWIDVGLVAPEDSSIDVESGLYDLESVSKTSLLSSAPIKEVSEYLAGTYLHKDGWLDGCDVKLGLTATRVDPRKLSIGGSRTEGGFDVPHQLERFGFSFEVEGGKPGFTNFPPFVSTPRDGIDEDQLTTELRERYPGIDEDGYNDFTKGVLAVAQATGAVPLVFDPVPVNMVYRAADGVHREKAVALVDGGVYDNRPFGFAARLRSWRSAERELQHRVSKKASEIDDSPFEFVPLHPYEFIMLEPGITDYEPESPLPDKKGRVKKSKADPTQIAAEARQDGALRLVTGIARNFLMVGTSAQLIEAADEYPYLRVVREEVGGDYITKLPARKQPVTSEHLARFLAFTEKDFRDFDFYIGMADARAYVAGHAIWSQTAIHRDATDAANAAFNDLERSKLELVEESRKADFTLENPRNNFERLILATRTFEQNRSDRSLEAWFRALEAVGYKYEDLPRLEVGNSVLNKRRMKSGTANWRHVAGLLREALGQIGDVFARAQRQTGQRMLWRAGLDYGMDGMFGYRFDWLTVDLGIRGLWGHTGFHVLGNAAIAGYLGGARVGSYLGVGVGNSIVQWRQGDGEKIFNSYTNAVNLESEYSIRSTFQSRLQRKFAVNRGLIQWELGLGAHFDVFHARKGDPVVLRWGPSFRLGIVLLRHLVLSAHLKVRTDGCRRELDWCVDERVSPFRFGHTLQRAGDDNLQFGLSAAWRFRPYRRSVRRAR